MRAAWVAAAFLLVPLAAPSVSAACPCLLMHDTGVVGGDTFSFKLNPDSGPGFKILAGSQMVITGNFAAPFPREWSAGFAFTNLFSLFGTAFFMGALVGTDGDGQFNPLFGDEWHVEALTNTAQGIQFDLNEPTFGNPQFTLTVNFLQDTHFDGDIDWYFGMSIPEAVTMRAVLDLEFNKHLDAFVHDIGTTGSMVPAEEFDGTFQSYSAWHTHSVDMEAQAAVPSGRAGYAWLIPYNPGSGAGLYQIDGPGSSDATFIAPGGGSAPGAIVNFGGGGAYTFSVPYAYSSGNPDGTFPTSAGYAAVLWGLRVPL